MTRLFLLLAAVGAVLAGAMQFTAQAQNTGWQAYDAAAFSAAQNDGKTIVVDVYADWCPTCRAQAPILDELRAERASADILFVKVNFDDEKAFLRTHRIPRQSTVLVFRGKREVARSIAETNRSRLRGVVLGAL